MKTNAIKLAVIWRRLLPEDGVPGLNDRRKFLCFK